MLSAVFSPIAIMCIVAIMAVLCMVMAATTGIVTFQGLQSGRRYSKHVYVTDTNATFLNWDSGLGASSTSANYFTCPENVSMIDMSLLAAPTVTTATVVVNGQPSGDRLQYAIQLAATTNRVPLNIPIAAGAQIQLISNT
jgi:hypothetical protein